MADDANGASSRPLTADEAAELDAELDKVAVQCSSLTITSSGDVLVRGRHPLGFAEQVIRCAPEDIFNVAHALSLGISAANRAHAETAALILNRGRRPLDA